MIFDLSPGRVTVASVADWDDTVVTMIYRHVEAASPEAVLGTVVISVDGDLDGDAAAHLDRALRRALAGGTPVHCDLNRTGFFGSAAARAVLSAFRYADETAATLRLRGVHGMRRYVLETVGLDRSLILE
jgi:anti-anti-sigma factor